MSWSIVGTAPTVIGLMTTPSSTQYNLLTGDAHGLIRGMLINLVEAPDTGPDDDIDDLEDLDQIAHRFPSPIGSVMTDMSR